MNTIKKLTEILFGAAMCIITISFCAVFTACSSNDEDPTYAHSETPEKEAAGTYTGTFTRLQVNSSTAEPETGEGTMIITPSENVNVAIMQFTCESLNITTANIPVNITFDNAGILFSNHSVSNPLGAPITGRISSEKGVNTNFQLKIRIGRSTKTYNVGFTGKRN